MPPLSSVVGYAEGERLLRLTDRLDTAKINPGAEHQEVGLMVVLFVVRARRLVKAVGCLVEAGLGAEAEMLNRALFEHAATVAWICMNPLERRKRWLLHDARDRLAWDEEVEKNTRPPGGAPGSGDRLLDLADRGRFERRVDHMESAGVKGMPKLRQIFEEIGQPDLYHYIYAYWSKGYEHPMAMALERYASSGSPAEGWQVDADSVFTAGEEPYESAVMSFHWVLDAVQAVNPSSFPWKAELDSVREALVGRHAS